MIISFLLRYPKDQQPISKYPEDQQLPTEICRRSTAPYRDISRISTSHLLRYLEYQQLSTITKISRMPKQPASRNSEDKKCPTEIFRRSKVPYRDYIRKINSPFRDIQKINSVLTTEIFGISTSRLLRYNLEYQQLSTMISGMSKQPSSRYPEDQQRPTEISEKSTMTC